MVFEKYNDIIKAYNNNRLAIFVGAGLSKEFDIPLWTELADYLLKYSFEEDIISKNVYDYCSSIDNNKLVISMIKKCFEDKGKREDFNNILKKQLDLDFKDKLYNSNYMKLHKFLTNEKYGYHGLFLTTNVDLCLDTIFGEEGVINNPSELNDNFLSNLLFSFRNEKIIHLHGSINDMNSIVFTEDEYKKRYQNSLQQELLKSIFENFTILFIGYGLNDSELLYFLKEFDNKSNTHYIIKGYHSEDIYEISKLEEDSYFKHLNIRVIPYEIKSYISSILINIEYDGLKNDINIKYKKDESHSNINKLINDLCSLKEKIEEPFDEEHNIIEILKLFKDNPFEKLNKVDDGINFNEVISNLKEYILNESLFNFFVENLVNQGITEKWFIFLCEYNILTFKNDKIDIHIMIFLLYHISKHDYINTSSNELFLDSINQLKCYEGNLQFIDNFRIIGIIININNESFDNELKEMSLTIFKNIDYVPIDKLTNIMFKLNDLNDYDYLFKYIKFIFSYEKIGFQIKTKLDVYEYKDIIDNLILKLDCSIKIKIIDLLIEICDELYNNGEVSISYSIFDIEKNIFTFYDSCIYALKSLFDDLEFKCVESYLIRLSNKKGILKQFYYYLLAQNYYSFKEYLWYNSFNPLNPPYSYEFSRLLDNEGKYLDEKELTKMIKWINEINIFFNDEETIYSDKLGWLNKLDQNHPLVKKELNSIPNYTVPYDYSNLENYESEDVPSTYYDILNSKSNLEIVEYINSNIIFNESELKMSFEDLITHNINRFENIKNFIGLPERFQRILFQKLNKKDIFSSVDNEKILKYILNFNFSNLSNYYEVLNYLEQYLSSINSKDKLFENVLLDIHEKINNYSEDLIHKQYILKTSIKCHLYYIMYNYTFKEFENNYLLEFIKRQLYHKITPELAYVTSYMLPYHKNHFKNELEEILKILFSKNIIIYSLRGILESDYYKNDLYEILNDKGILNYILEPEFRNNFMDITLKFSLSVYIFKGNCIYLENIITEINDINEIAKLIQKIYRIKIKKEYYNNFIKLWKLLLNTYEKHPDNATIYKLLNMLIKCVEFIDNDVYSLLNKTIGYISKKQACTLMSEYKRLCNNSSKYVGYLLINQGEICDDFKKLMYILEKLGDEHEYKLIKGIKERYKKKYPKETFDYLSN